jgi:hypothetical protein
VARVLNDPQLGQALGAQPWGPGQAPDPLLSLDDQVALAKAPKLATAQTSPVRNIVGKIWNAPNTALGAIYSGLGMGAGEIAHAFAGAPEPAVKWRNNALEFTNNPFATGGAITIGNTTTYEDDPYDPNNHNWEGRNRIEGHPVQAHELQHTLQGQQLGPMYLPSNIAGGLNAWAHGKEWHDPLNWNEVGPRLNPPAPWPLKSQ